MDPLFHETTFKNTRASTHEPLADLFADYSIGGLKNKHHADIKLKHPSVIKIEKKDHFFYVQSLSEIPLEFPPDDDQIIVSSLFFHFSC